MGAGLGTSNIYLVFYRLLGRGEVGPNEEIRYQYGGWEQVLGNPTFIYCHHLFRYTLLSIFKKRFSKKLFYKKLFKCKSHNSETPQQNRTPPTCLVSWYRRNSFCFWIAYTWSFLEKSFLLKSFLKYESLINESKVFSADVGYWVGPKLDRLI